MKFMILAEFASPADEDGRPWLDPGGLGQLAGAAEDAGVDALAFPEHPAPTARWLDGGGHETLDPFVALAYCAALTTRLKLMTYMAVLPHRNPLLTAKSMASLDVLSGGRTIFGVGAGYLRSEFRALGIDFEERNELFDEALRVLDDIFVTGDFSFEGRHFRAAGQSLRPGAVQQPRPPLWIGGNSRRALERVARWGQGWAPLLGSAEMARVTRTPFVEDDEALRHRIRLLGDLVEEHGRVRTDVEICMSGLVVEPDDSLGRLSGEIDRRAHLGVTWCGLRLPQRSHAAMQDALGRLGDEVIRPAA